MHVCRPGFRAQSDDAITEGFADFQVLKRRVDQWQSPIKEFLFATPNRFQPSSKIAFRSFASTLGSKARTHLNGKRFQYVSQYHA